MAFSLLKIHKTAFEIRPAKEYIDIDALKIIAASEEYGKEAKNRLKWAKYISKYIDFIEVWYRPNRGKIGRLEAELSMCDEWGEIRAAICGNLYYDIDGINMGYQIFCQTYTILTANNKYAPKINNVKSYISDRNFWINLVHDEYFPLFDKENTEVKYAIKQLFIRILNGGSIKKWKQDFGVRDMNKTIPMIGALQKEIKAATKALFEYLPEFKIKSKNSDKDTISHFIYETEKKCVEQLYIALGRPETYMYCKDGIMVLKSDFTERQIEAIIEQAKENIGTIYQIMIDFKIKPMVQEIELDELTLGAVTGYEAQKQKFEQKYCKIKDLILYPFTTVYGEIKFHSQTKLIEAERDFCEKVEKLVKNDKGEEVIRQIRFVDEWLDDPNKRTFLDVGIYPSDIAHECPSTVYNMWTPFLAEGYEQCPEDEYIDELEFLLNHILILCNHEKEIYDYFIRWFGQMLKYPSKKTTAPTFISEEGAGKGSLFELFRRVLGDGKVLETTKPETILGNHNTLLINAFLVIFNELSQKKIVEYAGELKGFITDKSIQINPKGKDQFKILSFHRLLNATNGETGGAISPHNGDRRNVIVRCSDELCKNKVYFDKFYECLDNKKLIRKFYDYCYNLDGLEKLELPPKTDHHKILINGNICHVKEFMKECTFSWAAQGLEKNEIMPITLYNNFKTYIEANGFKYDTNTIHLVRKVGLLKIPNSKGKSKGSRCLKFNINELINYFGLIRDAEDQLILEEAEAIDEDIKLERLEKIILERPKKNIDAMDIGVIKLYTQQEYDDLDELIDNLL
jgi:hypothetical protein